MQTEVASWTARGESLDLRDVSSCHSDCRSVDPGSVSCGGVLLGVVSEAAGENSSRCAAGMSCATVYSLCAGGSLGWNLPLGLVLVVCAASGCGGFVAGARKAGRS